MSSYHVQQRRLLYRGREFHFVSYAGQRADERRGEPAVPAMWFLMCAGKRWPVMPELADQEVAELDRALVHWVDEHVFGLPA